jgi:hypothetical protein
MCVLAVLVRRDEFIEGRKEMGKNQAAQLFEHARELSTRFSRTFR